jgi:hypothetical protein
MRNYRGKQITCVTSGLQGFGGSCETRDHYEDVFIGSVASATAITATEKRLQLVPEEVFDGNATGLVTVTTSQGACLGDIDPATNGSFT